MPVKNKDGNLRSEKRKKQFKTYVNIKIKWLNLPQREAVVAVDKMMDEMEQYLNINDPKPISREQLKHYCDEYTRILGLVEDSWSTKTEYARNKTSGYKEFKKIRRIMSKDIHTFEKLLHQEDKNEFNLLEAFEESRSVTMDVDEKEMDKAVGGAFSNRMHIKNGEIDGYFTLHSKPYDAESEIDKVVAKYSSEDKDVINFVKYIIGLQDDGTPNSKFSTLYNDMCTERNTLSGDAAFISSGYDSIEEYEKEFGEKLKEDIEAFLDIYGYESGTEEYEAVKAKCMVYTNGKNIDELINANNEIRTYTRTNATMYERHGMNINGRVDMRNSAMSAVAELINVDNVIASSKSMRINSGGKTIKGTIMNAAKGEDILKASMDSPLMKAGINSLENSPSLIEDIANLQILDYLCGNVDRHIKNFTYIFDENGKLIGIQGIDNDLSFGEKYQGVNYNVEFSTPLSEAMIIPEKTADAVMKLDPEKLRVILIGYDLDPNEIATAGERLLTLKEQIKKGKERSRYETEVKPESGYLKVVSREDIEKISFNMDLTNDDKKLIDTTNLFYRVKDVFSNTTTDRIINEKRGLIKKEALPHFHDYRRGMSEVKKCYEELKAASMEVESNGLAAFMTDYENAPTDLYNMVNGAINEEFLSFAETTKTTLTGLLQYMKNEGIPEDKVHLFTDMKNALENVSGNLEAIADAAGRDESLRNKMLTRRQQGVVKANHFKTKSVERDTKKIVRPVSYAQMKQSLAYDKDLNIRELSQAIQGEPKEEKKKNNEEGLFGGGGLDKKFPKSAPSYIKPCLLNALEIDSREIYIKLGSDEESEEPKLSEEDKTALVEKILADRILSSLINDIPKLADNIGNNTDKLAGLRDELIVTMRNDKDWEKAVADEKNVIKTATLARKNVSAIDEFLKNGTTNELSPELKSQADSIAEFNLMMKNGEGSQNNKKAWLQKYFSSKLSDNIRNKLKGAIENNSFKIENAINYEELEPKKDETVDVKVDNKINPIEGANVKEPEVIKADDKKNSIAGEDVKEPKVIKTDDKNNLVEGANVIEPGIQDMQEYARKLKFSEGAFRYGNVLLDICQDLQKQCKILESEGLKNKQDSFIDDRKNSSKKYQKMAECLDNAIYILDDGNDKAAPSAVKQALKQLYLASLDYYNSHVGVISGPISDYGQARLGVADYLTDTIPEMLNTYDNLRRGVCSYVAADGSAYGNKPYVEIAGKNVEIMKDIKKVDLAGIAPRYQNKENIKDVRKASAEQLAFRKKFKSISKTMLRNYEYTKNIDDYLAMKRGMSTYDKAKYYLMKEMLDKAYRPDITYKEVKKLNDSFNASAFRREVKKLAANENFKRCVRNNPDKALSEWKKIKSGNNIINAPVHK